MDFFVCLIFVIQKKDRFLKALEVSVLFSRFLDACSGSPMETQKTQSFPNIYRPVWVQLPHCTAFSMCPDTLQTTSESLRLFLIVLKSPQTDFSLLLSAASFLSVSPAQTNKRDASQLVCQDKEPVDKLAFWFPNDTRHTCMIWSKQESTSPKAFSFDSCNSSCCFSNNKSRLEITACAFLKLYSTCRIEIWIQVNS